jgi:hypothetical protein
MARSCRSPGHFLPLEKPRLRLLRWPEATSCQDACASSVLDDFYSDLRVRRVREHPPNVWPTWDLRGKQPSPALVMIVASRGPGASALRLAGAPGKGRDAVAPARLIASYALRAAGTSPGLYDFLQPRNALHVRRVEPGAWPGVAANPGSLSSPQRAPAPCYSRPAGYVWPGRLRLILFG